MGFTPLDNLSADGVATTLIQYLTEIQLPVTSCIAQSYDGAAVMAGVNSGVQVIVRDAAGNPCPYVHCHAHRLNLVLVDVAKQIDWVSDAFGLLEAVYAFQSVSPLRHKLFRDSQANEDEILAIPQQSDTRWVCKYAGVHYFHSRLHCVLAALATATKSRNGREKADARGLLLQLKSFDFIMILCLLHDLLPITQTLSLQLQSPSLDLSSCQLLVAACTACLQEKRCDEYFGLIWSEAGTKSAEIGVKVPHTQDQSQPGREGETTTGRRVSRPSQLVSDSNLITYMTTGNRTVTGTTDVQVLYRRKVFSVIDTMVGELQRRFSKNDELYSAVAACEPRSPLFLSTENIVKIANTYEPVKVRIEPVLL